MFMTHYAKTAQESQTSCEGAVQSCHLNREHLWPSHCSKTCEPCQVFLDHHQPSTCISGWCQRRWSSCLNSAGGGGAGPPSSLQRDWRFRDPAGQSLCRGSGGHLVLFFLRESGRRRAEGSSTSDHPSRTSGWSCHQHQGCSSWSLLSDTTQEINCLWWSRQLLKKNNWVW